MRLCSFLLPLFFLSPFATAQSFSLKEGVYGNGSRYLIRIYPESYERDGLSQVWQRVQLDYSALEFWFDPETGNATSTPWRKEAGLTYIGNYIPPGDYRLVYSARKANIMHLTWQRGGQFSVRDDKLSISIDLNSGSLLELKYQSKIAKWGLSNGWHSGPIKQPNEFIHLNNIRPISRSELVHGSRDIDGHFATNPDLHCAGYLSGTTENKRTL